MEPSRYLLTEGELKISKGTGSSQNELARIQTIKSSLAIAFFRETPWPVTLTANRKSTVLTVPRSVFETLDVKSQIYYYRNFRRYDFDLLPGLGNADAGPQSITEPEVKYIYSLYSRRRPDYSRSDLIQGVLKKIPMLPAFTRLNSSLTNDLISVKDIAETVKQDPSLAGSILKTVNSSYYRFGKNISDINHAIVLLGFNELYQLVLSEGIARCMPDLSVFHKIFTHSNCISRIAFALSFSSGVAKPAEISTFGLLHDMGESVKHLLKLQNRGLTILLDYLDAAALGAMLLRHWGLPEKMWRSIEYQNIPGFAPPDMVPDDLRDNVGLIYLSHVCFESMQGRSDDELYTPFLEDYKRLLGAEGMSVSQLTKKYAMPYLTKNLHTFPAYMREIIETQ